MSDKWYVVHVNTGSEDTVRKYILNQMEMDKCTDLIKDILVPTETIEEQVKGGKKKRSEKKFFPGYILVKTDLNEESWHFLKEIPKVIGFVGGKIKDGKLEANSVPSVDESEIDKMRNKIVSFEGTTKNELNQDVSDQITRINLNFIEQLKRVKTSINESFYSNMGEIAKGITNEYAGTLKEI